MSVLIRVVDASLRRTIIAQGDVAHCGGIKRINSETLGQTNSSCTSIRIRHTIWHSIIVWEVIRNLEIPQYLNSEYTYSLSK